MFLSLDGMGFEGLVGGFLSRWVWVPYHGTVLPTSTLGILGRLGQCLRGELMHSVRTAWCIKAKH